MTPRALHYRRVVRNYHPNSGEAYGSIAKDLGAIDGRIVVAVARHGAAGLTCEQIGGLTGLSHQSASAQVSRLLTGGILEECGTVKNARNRSVRLVRITDAAHGRQQDVA